MEKEIDSKTQWNNMDAVNFMVAAFFSLIYVTK